MTRSRHNGHSDHCAFPVPLWLKKYQLVALIKSGIRRIINGYLNFHCALCAFTVPLWLNLFHCET